MIFQEHWIKLKMELVGIRIRQSSCRQTGEYFRVINPDSLPIKEVVTEAGTQGLLVDATEPRKNRLRLSLCDSLTMLYSIFLPKACFRNGSNE